MEENISNELYKDEKELILFLGAVIHIINRKIPCTSTNSNKQALRHDILSSLGSYCTDSFLTKRYGLSKEEIENLSIELLDFIKNLPEWINTNKEKI